MAVPDRPPIGGSCTCSHPIDCNHECHGRMCDPGQHVCSIEFLPDEGGLTPWGCPECTPGEAAAHLSDCAAGVSTAPIAGRAGDGPATWA